MTTTTAPTSTTASVRPGPVASPGARRPRFGLRRRLLALVGLLALVVLAIGANYGPVRDYREARALLDKRTAEVSALKEQTTALRTEIDKLNQVPYIEGLARQALTYTRPDEDLYIVSGLDGAEGVSVPAYRSPMGLGAGIEGVASVEGQAADGESVDEPGFFEGLLSAIAGIFH